MKLVLTMILTDETTVLPRAIQSILPLVDAWVCSFNGKEAATPNMLREMLGHLPGHVEHRPWVNYGHNREEAIQLARPLGTHALLWDADEVLTTPIVKEALQQLMGDHDVLLFKEILGESYYDLPHLIRLDRDWRYIGTVHEYLDLQGCKAQSCMLEVVNGRDGAGAKVPSRDRYLSEARMLLGELAYSPGNIRVLFNLGQSYEQAGETDLALCYYGNAATLPTDSSTEELAWLAGLKRAELLATKPDRAETVSAAYLRCYARRPWRAEPLLCLVRWHRSRREFPTALMFARQAAQLSLPTQDCHYVLRAGHGGWIAWDELAQSLYECGFLDPAKEAGERALAMAPVHEQKRIRNNLALMKRMPKRG